ncbi:acyl-CoA dehydrogenase/oxidase, partial [Syncephalis pseudoplumigaleata]
MSISTSNNITSAHAASKEHPDLARERALASFSARQLTHLLNGGPQNTAAIERIQRILGQEKIFDSMLACHLSHEGKYLRGIQMLERLQALRKKHNWSKADMAIVFMELKESMPAVLSNDAIVETLETQATDEQRARWVPLAKNWAILGCYSQSELAHGSNVRGIETTATFLPESDELELNSPTLTSAKWWIAGMGRTACVALVMAQLVLADGTRAGIFPFMVQVRSFVDHKLLPGVETGNVGPSYGYNIIDFGYLSFKGVRIPRSNMLMRHAVLTREGKLHRTKMHDQRHVYSTLLSGRMIVIADASSYLSIGCTITTRYSLVRRQFSNREANKDATEEVVILDHQSQQHRVLVPICEAYAFHFTSQRMKQLYQLLLSQELSTEEANSMLATMHAAATALKPYMASTTSASLETLRRACGGHGYSEFSGFPPLITSYVQYNTGEGENHIMAQQAARALLK